MKDKIQIEAVLDFTSEDKKGKCLMKPISGDAWEDFGYVLELTGCMAQTARQYREWNKKEILDYTMDYLNRCLDDYKITQIPK